MSLANFLRESRAKFTVHPDRDIRAVWVSKVSRIKDETPLSAFVADRTPLFYRDYKSTVDSLKDGYALTTIVESLRKLPESEHFQSSHFGEIIATIFIEDILGYKKLYSKLSLNTTENQNAYKMDIVCFIPDTNPLQFVFCEVKSSPKDGTTLPAEHDKSCYADIFNSLREYTEDDKNFDLTAIKDRLDLLDEKNHNDVRESLKPYGHKQVGYLGIAVIDEITFLDTEVSVLASRKSIKTFDVELLCIEAYKNVSSEVFEKLNLIKTTIGG